MFATDTALTTRLSPQEERALWKELFAAEAALCDHLLLLDRSSQTATDDDQPSAAQLERAERIARIDALRPQHTDDPQTKAMWERVSELRWRLAVSVLDQVHFQVRRRRYRKVTREELEQAGLMGCHDAVLRFDPKRNVRLSTYARWWIRAHINETVNDLEFVARLPSSARRDMGRLDQLEGRGSEARRRELHAIQQSVSLDAPRSDGRTWSDSLEGSVPMPDQLLSNKQGIERLREARRRARLTKRHEYILQQRHDRSRPATFRAIGAVLGVSSERVRQLDQQAQARLRAAFEEM